MSTVLSTYLRDRGISDEDFAPLIGRDRSMVNKLRHGRLRPTLDLADAIERATDGNVPIRSWLLSDATRPAPAEQQEAA